jgi:large subunit ribosomal protein L15
MAPRVLAGAMTKTNLRWHKVVGNGALTVQGLTVQAHAFTGAAKEAIEGAGGKCQLLSPTTNEIVDMAALSA